jgi:hypothetical protein
VPTSRARIAGIVPAAAPLLAAIVMAVLMAVLTAVLMAVVMAGPAQAHDTTVLVKVTAPAPAGPGAPVRLSAVTTYPDGHKAGGLAVEAVATQGARKITVALVAGSRRGDWTGSAKLGPGRWSVKVTAAGKSHGTGSATVTVPAPAPATTTTVAPTTTTLAEQAASQALPAAAADGGGRMGTGTLVALGVAALVTTFVAIRTLSRMRKDD